LSFRWQSIDNPYALLSIADDSLSLAAVERLASCLVVRPRAVSVTRTSFPETGACLLYSRVEGCRHANPISLAMIASSLRAILDTAVDGIILMDARGTVTMFNSACERIFGYVADEIIGGDVKRLMPKPYQDEHDQYLVNYQQSRQPRIIGTGRQVVGRRKSGETFPIDLSVGEAINDNGVYYVGILRDISDRVRAEEERRRLMEQLAKSNEAQTHFVHAASHDLREPLRMVSAFCSRLANDYADRLDPRGAEYLSLAVAGSERMKRMLDDLVDFARLSDDAERRLRFDSLSKIMQRSDAKVTRGCLPTITANPIRFERLMRNLIGNALKYVAENVHPCIHVDAAHEGAFWRFTVADNGIGIDPRHFERIFLPFRRLNARGRYEGVGLGLAICQKIVEGFGGAMSVRSSEGQGSTFSFTMPADLPSNEDESHDA
jgi:two-component system sensor kinase FixL